MIGGEGMAEEPERDPTLLHPCVRGSAAFVALCRRRHLLIRLGRTFRLLLRRADERTYAIHVTTRRHLPRPPGWTLRLFMWRSQDACRSVVSQLARAVALWRDRGGWGQLRSRVSAAGPRAWAWLAPVLTLAARQAVDAATTARWRARRGRQARIALSDGLSPAVLVRLLIRRETRFIGLGLIAAAAHDLRAALRIPLQSARRIRVA